MKRQLVAHERTANCRKKASNGSETAAENDEEKEQVSFSFHFLVHYVI